MLHKHYYPVIQCPETNKLFNFFIKIMSGKIFLRGTKVHLIINIFSKKINENIGSFLPLHSFFKSHDHYIPLSNFQDEALTLAITNNHYDHHYCYLP